MAQPLQSINLIAPAFKGVNSEDSPIAQDPSFAEVADNCVIDKRGRIAARNGILNLTTDATAIGTDRVHKIHEFYDNLGNTAILSAGNNKILSGTTTLTDITPVAYTITANNWKIFNFNNAAYFFQVNQEPLIYTNTGGLQTFTAYNGASFPSTYWGKDAIGAYGRVWSVVGNTIYWSDLLQGTNFTTGSSGSIDVTLAWPDGYDEIVAIAAHNDFLVVWGEHSIILYSGANSPGSMAIADTIAGVGCIDRNSIQHIGTDVLFMSDDGLRSLGRAIQEKSLPISDLSRNVKTELQSLIDSAVQPLESVYSPENEFYLITFPDESTTYCFDLRRQLEEGSYRATRWPSDFFKCYERKRDGTVLVGNNIGIGQYSGYTDDGASYRFRYYSPSLTFGDPTKLKFLKKLRMTIIGANNAPVFLKWAYDFNATYSGATFNIGSAQVSEYGESEFIAYSDLSAYGVSSTPQTAVVDGETITYYVVDNYLGEAASAPTVGSGGGVVLNGDSYYNTTDSIYYVYVSGVWTDINTLTVSGSSEYSGGVLTTRPVVNATGSGSVISIGLESDVNGSPLSLQEINVLALIGKTI